MRITCAAPEALVADANQLAMCLAFGPDDANTYVGLNWQDGDGNLYAASSFEVRDEWLAAAQSPLTRPAWDTAQIIDMVAAKRAQAALVFSIEMISASPVTITAIGGVDGLTALTAMGLTAHAQAD